MSQNTTEELLNCWNTPLAAKSWSTTSILPAPLIYYLIMVAWSMPALAQTNTACAVEGARGISCTHPTCGCGRSTDLYHYYSCRRGMSTDPTLRTWIIRGRKIRGSAHLWRGCIIRCFLSADRTNGRAIVTLLRLSSSSVTLCIVAKRCVLEQKLVLRAYRKSYMRNRLVPKWMTLTFV